MADADREVAAIMADQTLTLSAELALALYRGMTQIRAFEERVRLLAAAGVVPGLTYLYSGQEAVAVRVSAALSPQDAIAGHHRGHGLSYRKIPSGLDSRHKAESSHHEWR